MPTNPRPTRATVIRVAQPPPFTAVPSASARPELSGRLADTMTVTPANTVRVERPARVARVHEVRLINPTLAPAISNIRVPPSAGVTRERLNVPVCPSAEVTHDVLFEEPNDPNQKLYLPRYRIAESNNQVKVSLEERGQGWSLSIELERYPTPRLLEQARDAKEIEHTASVILRHDLLPGDPHGGQKELAFSEVSAVRGGIRAVLQLNELGERDLLYQVLTHPDYGAVLTVRCAIRVAIPVTQGAPSAPTSLRIAVDGAPQRSARLKPRLMFKGIEQYEVRGRKWTRYRLSISNWADFPDRLFESAPDLPPCGRNTNAARTWVDIHAEGGKRLYGFCALSSARALDSLWFARPRGEAPPKSVYVVLEDRRRNVTYTSNRVKTVPGSGAPLFREVTRSLDNVLNRRPFVFPPALYQYVFRGITGVPDSHFRTELRQVFWRGRSYSYYQDPVQRHIFYFLPDAFKLVRRPESPHYPMLSVQFIPAGDSDEDVLATIEYWAFPSVDAERIEESGQRLRQFVPDPMPSEGLVFQPLLTGESRLFMALPRSDGSSANQERPDVLVDIRTGFRDSLTLDLKGFQGFYDAIFGGSALLFQGQVRVDLPEGFTETIPFVAQMNDMVGDLLEYTELPDTDTGGVKATLKNAIESPIRLNALSAKLRRGENVIPARIEGLTLEPPVELKPGEAVTFSVVPTTPSSTERGPFNAVFDLDRIEVVPDKEAVWTAILRPDTPAEYKREITVRTIKEVFGDKISAISIDFKRAGTVDFLRDAPPNQFISQVRVLSPIRNLVLRKEDPVEYEYKAMVIRRDGKKLQDREWRKGVSETLWITNTELPSLEDS